MATDDRARTCPVCGAPMHQPGETPEGFEPQAPLPTDLRKAAASLGDAEARYLVDTYYLMQDHRKRSNNQLGAIQRDDERDEPHATLVWFADGFAGFERYIQGALKVYAEARPAGEWAMAQYGIGPVITAGLLAHIDITQAPTVGKIWRFAGLDPTVTWAKGERRPWNAELKVLCWKIGDSFVKFHNRPECVYGKCYEDRKAYEVARDERGGNAKTAERTLGERTFRDKGTKATYESGHLPAGRLDQRAKRYATKLFLSHYHEAAYFARYGKLAPKPYVLEHMGHTDYIAPRDTGLIPGWREARMEAGLPCPEATP